MDGPDRLALARETGSGRHEAKALSGVADAYYIRGRMLSAFEHFDRCVELARRHRFGRIEASNLHMRAIVWMYKCQARQALLEMQDAVARAIEVGDPRAQAVAWGSIAELTFFCADLPRLSFDSGTRLYSGPNTLALVALITRDHAEASWALDERAKQLGHGSMSHNFLHFYPLGMMTCAKMGDWSRMLDAAHDEGVGAAELDALLGEIDESGIEIARTAVLAAREALTATPG